MIKIKIVYIAVPVNIATKGELTLAILETWTTSLEGRGPSDIPPSKVFGCTRFQYRDSHSKIDAERSAPPVKNPGYAYDACL
jgi:hypothetical protein